MATNPPKNDQLSDLSRDLRIGDRQAGHDLAEWRHHRRLRADDRGAVLLVTALVTVIGAALLDRAR